MNHSVFFTNTLGFRLDDYDPCAYAVVPAWEVLHSLKKPREGDDLVSKWAMESYEEAKKFLEGLAGAMIEIQPAGVVVGEYHIRPYMITAKQYEMLEQVQALQDYERALHKDENLEG
jgi:hypothetical protein